MQIQQAYTQLVYELFALYNDREASNIADMVIEHITGQRKIDRIISKQMLLNAEQKKLLEDYTLQLMKHKPVQYVLHETWFAGMKLYVDEHVLIPRPETEELVDWIVNEIAASNKVGHRDFPGAYHPLISILDIGTGSGCIPIALKEKLKAATIHAVDISPGALDAAKKNAGTMKTEINFHLIDILDKKQWKLLPHFDIIVSNPPYIRQSEAAELNQNILAYEPHLALFVPDNDALIFYRAIAEYGQQHLKLNGKLFFEINESLGNEVCSMLQEYGYSNVEIKKDMQGKDRMVRASKI